MHKAIHLPLRARPRRRPFLLYFLLAAIILIFLGGRSAVAYRVDLLWFSSLGYQSIFWKTCELEWGTFAAFAAASYLTLLTALLSLRRSHAADLPETHTIY